MTSRRTRVLAGARQVALTLGAVVGTVCILVMIAAVVFGVRPLLFRSGSMSPTIQTGAVALSQKVDAADIKKGDIVSVIAPSGSRVTHRVYTVEHLHGEAILQLKGDANQDVDETPYRVRSAYRVFFDVPYLGYGIAWLTSPIGLLLLGLYAAFLLSIVFHRPPRDGGPTAGGRADATPRGGRRRKEATEGPVARAMVLLPMTAATLASALALQAWTEPTLAAWTNSGTMTGMTQTAYTVPAPSGSSCALVTPGTTTSRGVILSWPQITSPATSYNQTVSTLTSPTATFSAASGTQKLTVTYNPGTTANQSKLVTVTANEYPTGAPTWLGATTTWKFKTGANNSTQPTCGEVNPPTGTITAPNSTSRARTTMATYLSGSTACTTTGRIFCGTMADASTITNVDYILQRTISSTVTCWSGSAWASDCTTYRAGTVGSQTAYYATGTVNTVYASAAAYVLTVRLTDTWSNVSTLTVSFTLT